MRLNVYLTINTIPAPCRFDPRREPVVQRFGTYHNSIPHSLGQMASEAGIYHHLWRTKATEAGQLIEPLETGLKLLKSDPERFKQFNPPDGSGDYGVLLKFVVECLKACKANPDATIHTCR